MFLPEDRGDANQAMPVAAQESVAVEVPQAHAGELRVQKSKYSDKRGARHQYNRQVRQLGENSENDYNPYPRKNMIEQE